MKFPLKDVPWIKPQLFFKVDQLGSNFKLFLQDSKNLTVNSVMKETFDMKRLQEMLEDSQSDSPIPRNSHDFLSDVSDSEVKFITYPVIISFLVFVIIILWGSSCRYLILLQQTSYYSMFKANLNPNLVQIFD